MMKYYQVYKMDESIIKSIQWTSSSQEDEILLIHETDEVVTKSIKWTVLTKS